MLFSFFNVPPPQPPPIFLLEQETAIVQPVEETKELTAEEKIAANFYECDESIEYIRADDATCLAKPVYVPPQTQNTVRSAPVRSSAPSGWYPYGQCTYWVWSQRSVGNWNNASEWLWQARRDGHATGSTPKVGAIAWEPGHVSYVTAVKGNKVTVSEMNYQGWGVVSYRTAPASSFQYIY